MTQQHSVTSSSLESSATPQSKYQILHIILRRVLLSRRTHRYSNMLIKQTTSADNNKGKTHTPTLSPRSRVLLEKPLVSQLLRIIPAYHDTRRFIATFTTVGHLSLFGVRITQSIPYYPTSRISF